MPIENKMISKSIESAQKKVEGNKFDIRKHLVEYDDVINKHRTAIYKLRREILETSEPADGAAVPAAASDTIDAVSAGTTAPDAAPPRTLSEIILRWCARK